MKEQYIKDILQNSRNGDRVNLMGWISAIRKNKTVNFVDIVDSTGTIQMVVNKNIQLPKVESSVEIVGTVNKGNDFIEVQAENVKTLGNVELALTPHPRKNFNVFANEYTENVAKHRHLYIRNPKLMASMKVRDLVTNAVRKWFAKTDIHSTIKHSGGYDLINEMVANQNSSKLRQDLYNAQKWLKERGG
jgi:aspartyl/asparaginyl-tRNA synthetase